MSPDLFALSILTLSPPAVVVGTRLPHAGRIWIAAVGWTCCSFVLATIWGRSDDSSGLAELGLVLCAIGLTVGVWVFACSSARCPQRVSRGLGASAGVQLLVVLVLLVLA